MNGCILVVGMPRSGTTWVGKLFKLLRGRTMSRSHAGSPQDLPIVSEAIT